jgi:hypothetical protein
MVHQLTANRLKANIATARVTFDPSQGVPLVGHMVGSSSRGPDNFANTIKPEIGAPGASVSAEVGTGNGNTPFGGTSGAAPMVTGSAALLHEAYPARSPLEIKAVLMNSAETQIMNRPAVFGGDLAPITRIGGGEVRVDRALHAPVAAWVDGTKSAAINFGFHDITQASTPIVKTIRVKNYTGSARTFGVSSTFRFANDVSNGAVSVSAPATVNVPANGQATFNVTLTIDGTKLRNWNLNSGSLGASSAALQLLEYDGYLWLDDQSTSADDAQRLHLPWQVLPRKSGDVSASSDEVTLSGGTGTVDLTNHSAVSTARIDTYSLLATSDNDPESGTGDSLADVDLRAFGVATFAVPAAVCTSQIAFEWQVNTWERQVHADAPALFEVDLDTNRDGIVDYAVFNQDAAGIAALSDGRNLTFVLNVATGVSQAFFFIDHGTNSSNTGLIFCGEQIGVTLADDVGRAMDATVFAVDFYQSGQIRDEIDDLTIVVGGERFAGSVSDIPAGATATMTITDSGADGTNPTESGILAILDAARSGFRGGSPLGNDSLLISVANP